MTEAHTARAHARLAPSAAHRWMECPGSVRMSAGIESKSSTYAAEGTAAHELAALCLTKDYDAVEFLGWRVDTNTSEKWRPGSEHPVADGVTVFEVDEEMVEGVQLYLDTVRSLKKGQYELDVEQRLDMTHIHNGIYGTGDAVVYQVDAGVLHVVDLKYGKGVAVEPTENPQLMLYGAGAARRYHNRVLNEVVLHIVQPRAPHANGPVRSWATDPLSLMEFEDVLSRAALHTEQLDAPLVAGDWCRFCPALPTCPAAREKAIAVAQSEFTEAAPTPETLSGEQLAEVLAQAEFIGNWVKAVQAYAHAEAVAGRTPTGFKLVPKRATRKWKDVTDAADALFHVYEIDNDSLYTEPELKSPAQVEKAIGKKRFATIEADLVTKVSSGSNLVPVSDARPSVRAEASADFAD